MERLYAENFIKSFFKKIDQVGLLKAFQQKIISDAEMNKYREAEEALGIGR
jgi:hypothetical protein